MKTKILRMVNKTNGDILEYGDFEYQSRYDNERITYSKVKQQVSNGRKIVYETQKSKDYGVRRIGKRVQLSFGKTKLDYTDSDMTIVINKELVYFAWKRIPTENESDFPKLDRESLEAMLLSHNPLKQENEKFSVEVIEIEVEEWEKKKNTAAIETTETAETKETKEDKTKEWFPKEVKHAKYTIIEQCLESDIPVYLAGPAGSGKNYTVEQICKEKGWNFFFSNSVQQEFKLTGFIDAGGKYHETEFYKACTSDKPAVFFLDEIDASIPEVLVLLNAAIANGYFEFPNGKVEFSHVKFVAAGNTMGDGADEQYTGRMVIDQATLDRFAIIEFGYDKKIEINLAEGNTALVEFIHQLRKASEEIGVRSVFSYRCIISVTKLEKTKMSLKDIVKIAVMKSLSKDVINQLKSKILANAAQTKYGGSL